MKNIIDKYPFLKKLTDRQKMALAELLWASAAFEETLIVSNVLDNARGHIANHDEVAEPLESLQKNKEAQAGSRTPHYAIR